MCFSLWHFRLSSPLLIFLCMLMLMLIGAGVLDIILTIRWPGLSQLSEPAARLAVRSCLEFLECDTEGAPASLLHGQLVLARSYLHLRGPLVPLHLLLHLLLHPPLSLALTAGATTRSRRGGGRLAVAVADATRLQGRPRDIHAATDIVQLLRHETDRRFVAPAHTICECFCHSMQLPLYGCFGFWDGWY
jgi:hypothetical protein